MDKAKFDQVFYEELGGQSVKIAQNPVELWEVVQRLNVLKPIRILEIGVYYGGTARIWQVQSGRLLGTHVEYADRGWLTFTPEGYYVAGGQAAEVEVHQAPSPVQSVARAGP